jgi:cysteine desulfurase/selenocysteine lyase
VSAATRPAAEAIDVARVRREFPILARTNRGRPFVYLDSAATAQKPRAVIDAISRFYATEYAAVHRSIFEVSELATRRFEGARETVAGFLGASDAREVVFTRNATEAINLVAASFGRTHVGPGDEVLLTAMEHHANIVPWQVLCQERGARLRVAPVSDAGELELDALEALLGPRTRIVAVTHVSNVLGTINPVRAIVERAHARDVPVLVDGAQAVPRLPVDVGALGCDFYVFSGHKLYGPTGIGALWARAEWLDAMPPYQTGGSMIESVSFEKTTFAPIPQKFEAGSPDTAGAVGLAAAIEWVREIGLERIARHEAGLLAHATALLRAIPGVRILGTAKEKTGVLSFVLEGVHPHDVGTVLDGEGVAIRAGHHCAQPLMDRFGVPATARASLGVYNDVSDVERLAAGVRQALELFAR